MKQRLLDRINGIIGSIDTYESTITKKPRVISGRRTFTTEYDTELYSQIKSSSLSLILNLYGKNHPYYLEFKGNHSHHSYKILRGILNAIKFEIANDWLASIKGLISAEIFSDFLEMSEHLLSENYKDASAVMIGSILEEHMRQLSTFAGNPIRDAKDRPKKANLINAELAKLSVYNKLDEKNITAWLDLRNKAAHGNYSEYNKDQVALMLNSVRDFILRNPLK
ncbi:hypothetical protein [uncultured Psychroserpens sp.]|uniref:hypothetical protein n=1 Tax=uncultured Psychroserpens sp. TaxID=255436 RepID=UPI0026039F2E|nr:hypothetical protein [uncultured Psychroserpens sp.]